MLGPAKRRSKWRPISRCRYDFSKLLKIEFKKNKRKIHILPAAVPNRVRPGAGQIPAPATIFENLILCNFFEKSTNFKNARTAAIIWHTKRPSRRRPNASSRYDFLKILFFATFLKQMQISKTLGQRRFVCAASDRPKGDEMPAPGTDFENLLFCFLWQKNTVFKISGTTAITWLTKWPSRRRPNASSRYDFRKLDSLKFLCKKYDFQNLGDNGHNLAHEVTIPEATKCQLPLRFLKT